jgi:hypothetical protein
MIQALAPEPSRHSMNRAVNLDETLQLRLNVLDTVRIPGRSC